MKDICSEVNETKRRLEKLEFIDEWQSSIEGWEGANVVYTSNEMLKSGTLTKISSGNTQERAFFLFDNLFVYCKKQYSSGMSTRKRNKRSVSLESEAAAKYQFKGRLPLNEIEIENVEDGTSDYHSNGKSVTNGWKVLNNAKRKWFVCIAKSAEEKKEWIEVIKREIEKGKHLKLLDDPEANQKATWSLIHDRALKLHSRMSSGEKPLIKDRKHLLKTHPKAFVGSEFVKWAMEQQEASSAEEAVALGQALLDNGFIHHINDRHNFKNSSQWYRFRFDDGTFKTKHESQDLLAKGTGQFPSPLKEHMHHLKSIPFSITGSKLVDWMVENGDACKKEEALSLGQYLIGKGFLHHVSDKHQFKDDQLLFRFFADEEKKESGSMTPTSKAKLSVSVSVRPDFHVIDSYTSKTIVLPCTEEGNDFAVEETEPITVSAVVSSSPAQLAGLKVGDVIQAVNGDKVAYSTLDDVLPLLREAGQHKEPLQLVILAERSHTCDIVPDSQGLGFEVRGHNPVFVSSVTSGGPAADVGLMPGYCIMQINGKDVSKASHNVVSLIRNDPHRSNSRPSSVNLDDDDVTMTSKGDVDAESPPPSKNRRSGFTLDDDLYDDSDLVRATLRKSVGRKRAQSLGRKKTDSFTTTDFSDVTNLMRAASLSSAGEKLKPCLSLTVGIGALEENVQYEYVSTEESRIYVFESLMESRYCFKVPSELYKIYAAEAERSMIYYENEFGSVAENVEEFGARRDARLKEQRQNYEQLALKLSQDRKKQTVAPCPTNCHLQVMKVDIIGNVDEEIPRGSSCEKVVYCYTTCGAPAAHYYDFTDGGLKKLYGSGQQHLVSDLKQLLHEVDSRLKVLESDQDLITLIGHVSDTTKSVEI
ncbi:phosphatidylinositol 3,4,5-trisphosphate-dependent Rac exchanger 1 protein-like isoform X2 [Oscarella lobularis]|uniref:phosphatidylinositol 3,4,5-trisphosphate-dependent Rac exchanger 1 protein-like isoform X2 n=1 Tax=Oscarella lobularis TaxID=121494 RepID=UPI0033136E67